MRPLEGLQELKKPAISSDYKVYNTKIAHMESDPTSYEEAMRSPHSSRWVEAMEDEMKSMSSNDVWDLEDFPKGAKIGRASCRERVCLYV